MKRTEAITIANIFIQDFVGHRSAFLKVKDGIKSFIYRAKIDSNNKMELKRIETIGEKENGKILKPMSINTKSPKVLHCFYCLMIKDMEKMKKDYLDVDDIDF